MPHSVQVWWTTRNGKPVLYVDESLTTSDGARQLEERLNATPPPKEPDTSGVSHTG